MTIAVTLGVVLIAIGAGGLIYERKRPGRIAEKLNQLLKRKDDKQ